MNDKDRAELPTNPESAQETPEVAAAHPFERFFFLKTTFGVLLSLVLAVGGLFAYSSLTKESLPDVDIPNASVSTFWPGADPQTIEEQVTQELESKISTLSGLKTFSSASFDSYSLIAVEFTAESDTDEAMQSLRDAISDAEASLPRDAEKPSIRQVSINDRPILGITLYGDVSDVALSRLGQELQERIETIAGVNEAILSGARDEIIQILLDPRRLLALDISPTQVNQAVAAGNINQPFGEVEDEEIGSVYRLEGQFQSIDDLRSLPIVRLGGALNEHPVRLDELGTVTRQLQVENTRAYYSRGGDPFGKTIQISIRKTPGTDAVTLIDRILANMDVWQQSNIWPDGVAYTVTLNEAEQISEALSGVFKNGLQAMLAVFIVLFLVLTWREGLIAGLSVPLSFFAALIAIWALGYSLNELVIIGMVLALGLLVDVFILMMEGIHQEIYERKKTFGQAVLATIHTYGMPAFAGQLTTILALAPLIAISGVSGEFIRVLPVTAIACLVAAYLVALLISVPLSRYLLGQLPKTGVELKQSFADPMMNRMAATLKRFSLRWTLSSRKQSRRWVTGTFALFILSLVAVTHVPLVLYTQGDGLNLGINIELPPSSTLETSQSVADQVGELLRSKPYFESINMLVGAKSPLVPTSGASSLLPSRAANFIGYSIKFVDREQRDEPSYNLVDALRTELQEYVDANVPGARLTMAGDSSGPGASDPISIDIRGADLNELQRLSAEVQGLLNSISGTTDVRDNLGTTKNEIVLRPIREATNFFGLSQQELAAQARFALSNSRIGRFATVGPEDDIDIYLAMDWQSRGGVGGGPTQAEELAMVRAFSPNGTTVSFSSLLTASVSEAPTAIVHREGDRALTVLAKLSGANLGQVIGELRPKLVEASASWPQGYSWSIGGEAEETAETFGSAGLMMLVALILVFGVLVLIFGSFKQSLILMVTMPLALIGTFLGFWLTGMSLSFFAVIGVISLVGIVSNDGIVMIDTMNNLLKNGASVVQAAADGAASRLRPILTTSITTIVGLVPLALGSPMYAPLCYAIIFGLVAATLLSLIIIPCLYVLATSDSHGLVRSLD